MKNTNFENCTGLDDTTKNHLTTALDVAIMSRELLKHEMIINYTTIWMDSLRNGQTELVNTNKLVRFLRAQRVLKQAQPQKQDAAFLQAQSETALTLLPLLWAVKTAPTDLKLQKQCSTGALQTTQRLRRTLTLLLFPK